MELPGVIIASKPQRKTQWLCLIFPMLLFYDQRVPKDINICLSFSPTTATTIHVGRYPVFYMRYYSGTILENSDVGGCGRDCCMHWLKLWFKKRKQPWTWVWTSGGLTLTKSSLTLIHGLLGGLAGVWKMSYPLSWLESLLHFINSSLSLKTTRWRRMCSAGIPPNYINENDMDFFLRLNFSLCFSNGIQVDWWYAFRLSQNCPQLPSWPSCGSSSFQ